jgi:hypothetical protein
MAYHRRALVALLQEKSLIFFKERQEPRLKYLLGRNLSRDSEFLKCAPNFRGLRDLICRGLWRLTRPPSGIACCREVKKRADCGLIARPMQHEIIYSSYINVTARFKKEVVQKARCRQL